MVDAWQSLLCVVLPLCVYTLKTFIISLASAKMPSRNASCSDFAAKTGGLEVGKILSSLLSQEVKKITKTKASIVFFKLIPP